MGDEMHSEDDKALSDKNKKRTLKTRSQLEDLEKFYAEHKYPTESMKAELAVRIGLKEKQISSWFCHRRLKDKRNGEVYTNGRQDRSSGVIQDLGSGLRQDSCGSTKQGDSKYQDPVEVQSRRFNGQELSAADLMYERGSHYAGNYSRMDDTSSGSSSSMGNTYFKVDPVHIATLKFSTQRVANNVKSGKPRCGPSGYLKVKGCMENAAITAVKRQLGLDYREDGPPLGIEFDPLPPEAFDSSTLQPANGTESLVRSCHKKGNDVESKGGSVPFAFENIKGDISLKFGVILMQTLAFIVASLIPIFEDHSRSNLVVYLHREIISCRPSLASVVYLPETYVVGENVQCHFPGAPKIHQEFLSIPCHFEEHDPPHSEDVLRIHKQPMCSTGYGYPSNRILQKTVLDGKNMRVAHGFDHEKSFFLQKPKQDFSLSKHDSKDMPEDPARDVKFHGRRDNHEMRELCGAGGFRKGGPVGHHQFQAYDGELSQEWLGHCLKSSNDKRRKVEQGDHFDSRFSNLTVKGRDNDAYEDQGISRKVDNFYGPRRKMDYNPDAIRLKISQKNDMHGVKDEHPQCPGEVSRMTGSAAETSSSCSEDDEGADTSSSRD